MAKLSVEEIIRDNLEMARQDLLETGEFVGPVFIIHAEQGFIPVIAPFRDDSEKGIILRVVSLLMLKYNAYAYSVVHEAWFATRSQEEGRNFDGQVKDLPDKKEAIVSSYVGYDRKEMHIAEVIREDGKPPMIKPPTKFEGEVGGTFFGLLPPAEIHNKPLTPELTKYLDMLLAVARKAVGLEIKMIPIKQETL